jgi:protein TonB
MKKLILFFNFILITNIYFAQIAPEELTDVEVDIAAEYPGGLKELSKFIAANLNYPQSAIDKNREGKCFINFIIEKNGKVSNIKLVKKVKRCRECNQEAIRVIKMMPLWKPAYKNNQPVRSRFTLPINFQLE